MRELRKHIIIALVEDKPGVLNRIASKWRQRGFNIESLAVGHSETAGLSRMTFVVDANTDADQVVKQLDKVVDVVEIRDISGENIVSREMALIKVKATAENRSLIIEIVHIFRADIIDVGPESLIIEVTGPDDKIDAMFDLLENYGVVEMVRTGRVALVRGAASSTPGLHELGEEPFERYPEGETPYSSE
ncbi:MAG: acetolactate synthase small subunit [Dehalococcoidia bacterium]|nr:MAG: acetolactate synthase small subunit [Dehalococcoidia bacterium]